MRAMGGGPHAVRSIHGMRRRAGTAALLGCLVLLAGCASMPSSGEVSKVGSEAHNDADSQVRVYGVKPQKGELAADIVSGFLEATTSNEADYDTAREYLAKGLKKTWQPNRKITILSGGAVQSVQAGSTNSSTTVSLSGTAVAAVDSKHAYRAVSAASKDFSAGIHLSKERGEWRIDSVPDGLVLSEADFLRLYQSVDIYYYASIGQAAVGTAGRPRDVLVADPVYLRSQVDLLQNTVGSLLSGPTDWLDPVVASAFPSGTQAKRLSLDDSQHLTVRLSKTPGTDASTCHRMAAQLMNTVQGVASLPVASVELQRPDGAAACSLSQQQAAEYAPDQVADTADQQQYFIDTTHHLVSLYGNATAAERVPGPLGAGQVDLGSVAVRRDETYAAGVKTDGSALYVTGLTADAALGEAVLKSSAHGRNGLSAPSWDGYNDLWVADRNPANPRLLMLQDGAGTPAEVSVPDLKGGRIESLRVAADGVRIAMLVTEGSSTTLRLGRVERGGTQAHPEFTVTALRQVTPYLEDVKAASWAGVSRLVVVGQESGGVQQIQYVGVDGSTSDDTTVPGISGVTSVAASESQDKPLLASLGDGIFRLPTDGNWKAVTPKGSSPVYPG